MENDKGQLVSHGHGLHIERCRREYGSWCLMGGLLKRCEGKNTRRFGESIKSLKSRETDIKRINDHQGNQ